MMSVHITHEFETVAVLQCEIDDDDVRVDLANGAPRLRFSLRFAAHFHVGLSLDHSLQTLTYDGMIVDDQDASATRGVASVGNLGARKTHD